MQHVVSWNRDLYVSDVASIKNMLKRDCLCMSHILRNLQKHHKTHEVYVLI